MPHLLLIDTSIRMTCLLPWWRRLKQAMVREEEEEEDKVRWRVDAELRLRQDEQAAQAGAAAAAHSAEIAALRVQFTRPGVSRGVTFDKAKLKQGPARRSTLLRPPRCTCGLRALHVPRNAESERHRPSAEPAALRPLSHKRLTAAAIASTDSCACVPGSYAGVCSAS